MCTPAGESTTDLSTKIVKGRIAGGVAILWNVKYDSMVKIVRLNVDWAIGLEFNFNGKIFIILNVYTPYQSYDHVDEYVSRLACIQSFIEDNSSTCIYVLGDFNADLANSKSLFYKHLLRFSKDSNLVISSKTFLPDTSYTYISEAWNTTSWLDHVLSTADAHASLQSIEICYGLATTDHIPIAMVLNVQKVPKVVKNEEAYEAKINWGKLSEGDVLKYCFNSDAALSKLQLPMTAIWCTDMNCGDTSHRNGLCDMYNDILKALIEASGSLFTQTRKTRNIKPGWNHFVANHHTEAWVLAGRPRQGPELEHKKKMNAKYKYALRYITKHEQVLSASSMADHLLKNNITNFWNEVKTLNRTKTALPCNIEGVTAPEDIVDLWRQHYSALFNCIKSAL